MNTKQSIIRTGVIFTVLALAGVGLAVASRLVPDAFAQTILVAIGSAIFGAGLAFFLVRISALTEK
jgi:hypothetical protein